MIRSATALLTVLIAAILMPQPAIAAGGKETAKSPKAEDPAVARGRYLVAIGSCNDCHTTGSAEKDGLLPEKEWLTGDPVGWRGPWGTTYPINVRLFAAGLNEDEWVKTVRATKARPPMPWYVFRDMEEKDVRAIYRFLRYLGPAGNAMPEYVPPDREPSGPYLDMTVRGVPQVALAR